LPGGDLRSIEKSTSQQSETVYIERERELKQQQAALRGAKRLEG
jgi:hypothetical protein